eukprot:4164121-Pleurochrysis_carterae.AAC.1
MKETHHTHINKWATWSLIEVGKDSLISSATSHSQHTIRLYHQAAESKKEPKCSAMIAERRSAVRR